MSQVDDLASRYPRSADVVAKSNERRSIDWAVLVVAFALGITVAWVYFLCWAALCAFRGVFW